MFKILEFIMVGNDSKGVPPYHHGEKSRVSSPFPSSSAAPSLRASSSSRTSRRFLTRARARSRRKREPVSPGNWSLHLLHPHSNTRIALALLTRLHSSGHASWWFVCSSESQAAATSDVRGPEEKQPSVEALRTGD